MPDRTPISPETILQMAEQILGAPVTQSDAQSLAALLNNLMAEMDAMHNMDLAAAEPATLYEARP